jgi:uncharacterized protein YlxW (UPF0749 family)
MPNLSKISKTIITRFIFVAIFLLLGLVIANQYVLYSRIDFANTQDDPEGTALRLSRLYSDNEKLREQVNERQAQLSELQDASTSANDLRQLLERDEQKYKVMIGDGIVEGGGVIISINHTMVLTQVIDFVNALKNSGAESISINEKRIVSGTPLNEFDGKNVFHIKVIGDKEVLYSSITRPGGIFELIINGTAERSDNLVLPKV